MPSRQPFTVDLEPVGRRVQISEGQTLLEAAQQSGVELVSLCGGIGACRGCKVRLVEGRLSPIQMEEESQLTPAELAEGCRLACQARPLADVKLDIPPESLTTPQRLQVEGEAASVALDPVIAVLDVRLDEPTTHDLRPDMTRLLDALGTDYAAGTAFMGQLAHTLRANGWSARLALRGGNTLVAAVAPGAALYGLAVDVGTTKLAAYLIDLETGQTKAKAGAMNPQIAYGEDVISRIVYCRDRADGAATLQGRLAGTLNELIDTLCAEAGIISGQIVEVVMVGNTVMHHIIAGLPVGPLGEAPYLAITHEALNLPASAMGLKTAPDARLYMPPIIAGYVGADHVAMLLATESWRAAQTTIALDIGTNTEISLRHRGQMWSCSCASGPAFEGAHINDGMRAAPGAIERVQVVDGAIRTQTIGGRRPTGICGSGILDAVAVMAQQQVVDGRGSLNRQHPLLRDGAFVLAAADESEHGRVIALTRADVSEIQLAKAAIRAGVELLLQEAGIASEAIEQFIIAGAFGTYISLESAVSIGMFPVLPRERYHQVGNAAGMGACSLLVSAAQREIAAQVVRDIHYVELTTHADFQNTFIQHLTLDDPDKGPL